MRPAVFLAILLGASLGQNAIAQGSAFTYQGRLSGESGPLTGLYDLRFAAYATLASGAPIASQTNSPVAVSNGLFTVSLNLGVDVFTGPPRWLEIAVRTNNASSPGFEVLGPRQPITPTPYAMTAGSMTGPVPDSLLSANIARLLSSPTFTGTVSATSFVGSGSQLTGITSLDSPSGGPVDALRVDRFGHVGIGTNDSGAALQVHGGTNLFSPGELESMAVVTNGWPGVSNLSFPVNVFVQGTRAYVTTFSPGSLQIFNVVNPSQPQLLGEAVDDSARPGSPFTRLGGADGIYVTNNLAYVTAENENAVTIINVANPFVPFKVAEIVDGSNGFNGLNLPTGVLVQGNSLFVLGFSDSALSIINIATPGNPQLIREIYDDSAVPGSPFTKLQWPYQMTLVGTKLYIAARGDHAITIIDVANPANPQLVAEIVDDSVNPGSPFTKLNNVNWVEVVGNIAYAVSGAFSSAADHSLTIIDVSNPFNPVKLSEVSDETVQPSSPFTKLRGAWGIKVSRNTAFVTSFADNALSVIDVSNPREPRLLRELVDGQDGFNRLNFTEGLTVVGNTLYVVASGDSALNVFNLVTRRISLVADGWVGIGTGTPRSALDVAGTIFADEVRATGEGTFGRLSVSGSVIVDRSGTNNGALHPGLLFGNRGTEGMASRQTPGGNLSGLDFYTLSQSRMSITAGGFVGIGTTSPALLLHVNGAAGKPGGGSWSVASDERFKKDIRPLEDALTRLLRLRGVTFEYLDPTAIHELPGPQTGMVAQEVERVFPEWIETRADGMKCLSVRGFEALTVEALRELREEKDREIAAIKAHNSALEKRLEHLEKLVSTLARAK